MKKFLFIIISLILCIPTVYALDECTPSDEYLEYLSLSEEERSNMIEPFKCKEMLNLNDNTVSININRDLDSFLGASVNLSRYNAKDDNLVSPVQNQYKDGTCWAFSSLSVVETNAMKNGLPAYNLSEAHMAYSLIDDFYIDSPGRTNKYFSDKLGGKITYPATYFFNNQGMLLESELSYTYPNLNEIYSSQYISGRHILSVDKFELININTDAPCSYNEIYNIKRIISQQGSVQATINSKNLETYTYFYTHGLTGVDHAITIVGWDDNMSKELFGASRDGAWIVKNSWGTDWGNQGYFYVSYDDDHVCQGAVTYQGVNNTEYDHTYKSSELVGTGYREYDPLTYIATRFTKQSTDNEYIKKISFPSAYADHDTDYSIYITFEDNWKDSSKWKLITTASSNALGIESVYVNVPIESNTYTIIIKYLSQTSFYSITTGNNSIDTVNLTYDKGHNYIASNNTSSWYDMADPMRFSVLSKPNVYVYTSNEVIDDSTITVDSVDEEDDGITLNITNNNILDSVKVYYEGTDVTSDFDITINGNKVLINNYNNKSGRYNIVLTDNTNKTCHTFYDFKESMALSYRYSLDTVLDIITIPPKTSYEGITNNIVLKNSNLNVYNEKDVKVSSGYIGTGYSLKTNNKTYFILVKGDVDSDGYVDSSDLLAIVKYLKGIKKISAIQTVSADVIADSSVDSADLLRIVKYLKGTTSL